MTDVLITIKEEWIVNFLRKRNIDPDSLGVERWNHLVGAVKGAMMFHVGESIKVAIDEMLELYPIQQPREIPGVILQAHMEYQIAVKGGLWSKANALWNHYEKYFQQYGLKKATL